MTTTKSNSRDRILSFLMNGRDITTNQARSRFGIQNVAARVLELRDEGFPIYTNRKSINGHSVLVYRMGTFPERATTSKARRAALTAAA